MQNGLGPKKHRAQVPITAIYPAHLRCDLPKLYSEEILHHKAVLRGLPSDARQASSRRIK